MPAYYAPLVIDSFVGNTGSSSIVEIEVDDDRVVGYAAFEGGKRFVQSQGIFVATTYALLIAAPINILVNWLLVWYFRWGFFGAPIAVAVTQTLMPLLLLSYVYFIGGSQCWGGFSTRALTNWGKTS